MTRKAPSIPPRAAVCVLLVLITLVAFWPVLGNDFINYDDDRYVTENPHVQQGLSAQSLLWACTTLHASNWHPLTWISHMTDWELFGRKPFGHHLTSLLLHVANTLLLFLLLERMTGAVGRSAFVAALFGVHPLHVQSVAWIAERKDVLSTLFWLLTIAAYVRYVRAPGPGRYALVLATFALGLTAKPMLVTLPLTLLILDFWPLRRAARARELLPDKLPLLALSAASSVVTILAQRHGEALATLESYPASLRVLQAAVSTVVYLGKAVWPSGLSVFYPRGETSFLQAAGALLVIGVVSWLALRERNRRPYVLAGWLFYLVTLVPVLGLVQVGAQARADRYTYVPLIGIFWIVAWGLPDLVRFVRARAWRVAGTAAVLVLALSSRANASVWRDSITLFERALAIEPVNFVAHNNLGVALAASGRAEEAVRHYEAALRVRPDDAKAHSNLASVLAAGGRLPDAARHAAEAVRLDPDLEDARFQLGVVLSKQGRDSEAIEQYGRALALDPEDAQVHNNLGSALARMGRMEDAVAHFRSALALRPDYGAAHANLAAALLGLGRRAEAREELVQARRSGFEPPPGLVRELSGAEGR